MTGVPLVIALNRGRVLDEFLPMMTEAGITPAESLTGSRKLVFDSVCGRFKLVVMRGADVPTYVEYGAADLGVAGKDTLLEYTGSGFYERLDLGIARCRIMTAGPAAAPLSPAGPLRVATKFVNCTKRFFAEKGRQVEVIKLSGAMEIAPLMGLADLIVDIVDSGNTLRANGLVPLETIANVSSRIIVNRASQKMKLGAVNELLGRLTEVAASRG